MKHLKHLLTAALAMFVALVVATPAWAATGDITVNGAIKDAKYDAYKIFDVTYDANDSSKVSYTLIDGVAIQNISGFSDVFTTTTHGGKTYVEKKGEEAAVITWLKNNEEAIVAAAGSAKATVTNTAGSPSITLATGEIGYYFITSVLGDKSAVTIDTAHPEATVNSKIETEPNEPGKKIKIGDELVDITTLDLGTVVPFELTFNATNYAVKDGESTVIYQYVIEDAPDGFAIDANSVAVALDQSQSKPTFSKSVDANGKLTVTITWATGTGTNEDPYVPIYKNPTKVTVTYNATLTKITDAKNGATFKYNDEPFGTSEDHVYSYKVDVEKVDKDKTTTKLPGAQFALKKGEKYYKYTAASGTTPAKVEWVDSLADATTKWTSTEGTQDGTTYQSISFEGLAAGDYTLVEVTAPKGYNLAADENFTLTAVEKKLENTNSLTVTMNVKDSKGSVLPSTGGIGTTIFYIVGGVMIVGAIIALITKKRVNSIEG